MHMSSAAVKPPLIAVCLMMLAVGPWRLTTARSPMCWSIAGSEWLGITPQYCRRPRPGGTRVQDQRSCRIEGLFVFPAVSGNETAAKHFILLLQGSASSSAQLAETASGLALAAKREVFVYEYRGYASESTPHPTAAAIQRDIDGIIDSLSERGRRGVVIGLSMGGIFAIQSLKRSKSGDLRALVDSAPAQVPTIPFLLRCPRWMNPSMLLRRTWSNALASSLAVTMDGQRIRRRRSSWRK